MHVHAQAQLFKLGLTLLTFESLFLAFARTLAASKETERESLRQAYKKFITAKWSEFPSNWH